MNAKRKSGKKKVVIDPHAGFCGGVRRAIHLVEKSLTADADIFVRGELIHNPREMKRLEDDGLKISPSVELTAGDSMFIRTHGETPDIYERAEKLGLDIIDATCRNVRKSQHEIKNAAEEGKRVYIFGKQHHPEVIGLCGYCKGSGVVIQSVSEIDDLEITDTPSLLIPQTTAHPDKFEVVRAVLNDKITELDVYNAICPFVSHREDELREFAASVDAIVFIGGKQSSNTAVLFSVCRQVNENAFFVDHPDDLDLRKLAMFRDIGISGSASTPMWQIEEIAKYITDTL